MLRQVMSHMMPVIDFYAIHNTTPPDHPPPINHLERNKIDIPRAEGCYRDAEGC